MAAGAFAMEKNVGFGILYNHSTTSGTMNLYYDVDWKMPRNGFGAFGFFGLSRFLELNLGVLYKNVSKMEMTVLGQTTTTDADIDPALALQLGVYGKYPFLLSERFVVFPTVGIDYEMNISDDETWWADLWFRAGGGVDFFLSNRIFIRGHLIYGAAIPIGGGDDLGLKLTHGFLAKFGIGWMC
jgi:hypothetical protein